MKSVTRVVTILTYLQEHSGARLNDIAEHLGIHKSNASRLVKSLEQVGWIARDTTGLSYRIGPGLISVGQAALNQFALSDQLIPMMQALRDVSGETVHLAVFENNEMLHVRRVESAEVVRVVCPPGTRDRLHSTAVGKAFLASLPAADLSRLLESINLERRTPNTITDRTALLAEVKKIRARGYAVDHEEGRLGVRCIGLALVDRSGRPVGALSITGPAARWTQHAMDKVIGQLMSIAEQGAAVAGLHGLKAKGVRRLAS